MRLLRVLIAAMGQPVTSGELAGRAALARTSIYQALDLLEQTGIVTYCRRLVASVTSDSAATTRSRRHLRHFSPQRFYYLRRVPRCAA